MEQITVADAIKEIERCWQQCAEHRLEVATKAIDAAIVALEQKDFELALKVLIECREKIKENC